jgi:hypothetical protein
MEATIEPPALRNVTLKMTENEALLLRKFIGKQAPRDVEKTIYCLFGEAHGLINGIYDALGKVLTCNP